MPEPLSFIPVDLSAPGRWSFHASYEVHDGWGGMSGEGDSIEEAIEAAFEDNCDGNLDEAWSTDQWVIDSLSFEGQELGRTSISAYEKAESALLTIDLSDADKVVAAVHDYQAANGIRKRVRALESDLENLLVARNQN